MGVSEIRSNLIKLLSSIEDERLLLAIHRFLENRNNSEEGRMWNQLDDAQKQEVLRAYKQSYEDGDLIAWDHLPVPQETLIKKTIHNLTKLPDQKLKVVSDFTEFLVSQIEDQSFTKGIQQLVLSSKAYEFLEKEEDLYTVEDLKEKYR